MGFAEIDWVFCLTRTLRQCGHRYRECRDLLASGAVHVRPLIAHRFAFEQVCEAFEFVRTSRSSVIKVMVSAA